MDDTTCWADDCEAPVKVKGRGLCNKHYLRFRKDGTLPLLTTADRFWAKVDKQGPVLRPELGPCWVWTAALDGRGYGAFAYEGRVTKAHRAAYLLLIGSIPEGQYTLHRCDNPPCVRPDHLFLGTQPDNMADMRTKGRAVNLVAVKNRAKTHCPQGHPYDEVNTYVDRRGKRQCRACTRERSTRYNHLRRNK